MSNDHNADDVDDLGDSEYPINRRSFLRELGIAGGATAVSGLASTTAAASPIGRSLKPVPKDSEESLIRKIRSDSKVGKISEKLREENKEVRYEKGRYGVVSTDEGDEFRIAVIPVDKLDDSAEVNSVLRWSEKSEETTQVSTVYQEDSIGDRDGEFKEQTIWVQNDTVETHSEVKSVKDMTGDSGISSNDNTTPPGGGGGVCYRCGCKTVVTRHCTNWDLSCLAWKLTEIGVTCNPWTGIVTCAIGNIVAWGPFVTGDNCGPCDNYDVSRVKIGYACE